jgi:hypothetical protein
MLFYYANYCCLGFVWLSLLFMALAGYAYRVNAKRAADDPDKKDFPPGAIFLAPITWPMFLLGSITLFIIKALAYGIFLILFTFALLAFQNSDLPDWVEDSFSRIGNKLLEANKFLIKVAFGDWYENPQPI